jgi:polygalacturonase
VNGNNDGFHFISTEYATVSNCIVKSQDDACAMFGSCRYITITNSSFSTRWSVFRFGGGSPSHIAVANCLIYETYGCPIKFGGGNCSNMTFDNLIMRDVTGPISLTEGGGFGRRSGGGTNNTQTARPRPAIRNISFSNIQATVVKEPQQQEDMPFVPGIRDGERFSCITLNAVNGGIIENITFNNIHVTSSGGGTAEMGAVRDVSTNTGEYFGIGIRPAYGLYARGVKGLSLQNVRLDTASADLRPALILDGVTDAAIDNLSVQGNNGAESALRFINTQDALVTGARLLTSASVFLAVEGARSASIKIDGGDFSKAGKALKLDRDANEQAVKIRE